MLQKKKKYKRRIVTSTWNWIAGAFFCAVRGSKRSVNRVRLSWYRGINHGWKRSSNEFFHRIRINCFEFLYIRPERFQLFWSYLIMFLTPPAFSLNYYTTCRSSSKTKYLILFLNGNSFSLLFFKLRRRWFVQSVYNR